MGMGLMRTNYLCVFCLVHLTCRFSLKLECYPSDQLVSLQISFQEAISHGQQKNFPPKKQQRTLIIRQKYLFFTFARNGPNIPTKKAAYFLIELYLLFYPPYQYT